MFSFLPFFIALFICCGYFLPLFLTKSHRTHKNTPLTVCSAFLSSRLLCWLVIASKITSPQNLSVASCLLYNWHRWNLRERAASSELPLSCHMSPWYSDCSYKWHLHLSSLSTLSGLAPSTDEYKHATLINVRCTMIRMIACRMLLFSRTLTFYRDLSSFTPVSLSLSHLALTGLKRTEVQKYFHEHLTVQQVSFFLLSLLSSICAPCARIFCRLTCDLMVNWTAHYLALFSLCPAVEIVAINKNKKYK